MSENTPKINSGPQYPKYLTGSVLKEKTNYSSSTSNSAIKSTTINNNKATPKTNKTQVKSSLGSAAISNELKARLGANHQSHIASHSNSVQTPVRTNRPAFSTNSIGSNKKDNSEKKKPYSSNLASSIASCNQAKSAAGLSTPLGRPSTLSSKSSNNVSKNDITEYYSNPNWKSEYGTVAARKAEFGYSGPGFIVEFDCESIHLKNLFVKKGLYRVKSKNHASLAALGPMIFLERIDQSDNKTPSKTPSIIQQLDFNWTPSNHNIFNLLKQDLLNDSNSMASSLNLESRGPNHSILLNSTTSSLYGTSSHHHNQPKKKVRFQDLQKIDEKSGGSSKLQSPLPPDITNKSNINDSFTLTLNKNANYAESPLTACSQQGSRRSLRKSFSASDISKLIFSNEEEDTTNIQNNTVDYDCSNIGPSDGTITIAGDNCILNSTYDKVSCHLDPSTNISLQISPMHLVKKEDLIQCEEETNCKLSFEENKNEENREYFSLSLAIPVSSILNSNTSVENLANQIARACVINLVNEIIIYNDCLNLEIDQKINEKIEQFKYVLEYLECPPSLRKMLFKSDDKNALTEHLMPIESLHHVDASSIEDDWSHLDGVVIESNETNENCWIDFGPFKIQLNECLESGKRVTVQKDGDLKFKIINPTAFYWGYKVKYADSGYESLCHDYDCKIAIESGANSLINFSKMPIDLKTSNKFLVILIQNNHETINESELNFYVAKNNHLNKNFGCRSLSLQELIMIGLSNFLAKLNEFF